MNHRYCVLVFALSCLPGIRCGAGPEDARSQGLGGAGVMLTGQAHGLSNPACLSELENPSFILHAEDPFMIPELSAGALCLGLPTKTGSFGLGHHTGSFGSYRESKTTLAFGRTFGKRFSTGIELGYYHIRQYGDYRSFRAVVPAFGFQFRPIAPLVLGLYLDNPAGQAYNPAGCRKLPVLFRAGLGYQPNGDILFCMEYARETGRKPLFRGGIEGACGQWLRLRLGISSEPCRQFTLGLGLHLDRLKADLAISHHAVLGYSPAITLVFSPEFRNTGPGVP